MDALTSVPDSAAAPAVVVRSIRPDDAPALQAFHRRLSEDTVHNRFFGLHPELSEQEARRFTSLAAGEETALVATVDNQIVAVGRFVRLGGGDAAEVAFVVSDGYQHHGIGTTLLSLLARLGWGDGLRRFVADTFSSNRSMLDVFMHTPEAVTVVTVRHDGSAVHLVMRITPPPGLQTGGGASTRSGPVTGSDQRFAPRYRGGTVSEAMLVAQLAPSAKPSIPRSRH